MFSTKMIS